MHMHNNNIILTLIFVSLQHAGQCDLYVQYPYNELPMCQTEESNQKFPDKLANELADETNWD